MTQTNNSTSQTPLSLTTRMFIGGGIGLFLISLYLFPIQGPDPAWGKFWMIRPLIIVTFAGAMGGLCNYYIFQFRKLAGVSKPVAVIISVIVFIVGLWLGTVLGLDGTLWD